MKKIHLNICSILIILTVGLNAATVLDLGEGIKAVADRLVADQIKFGDEKGTWPDEAYFTGAMVAGLVEAYQATCDNSYLVAAEMGGDYIVTVDYCDLFGEEAYALMKLSQVAPDPCDNQWRDALADFYDCVKNDVNGTEGYIAQLYSIDSSVATFYLANYVMGANYVNATDMDIWRNGLIDWLAQVDDLSLYPVMAVGAATWALSSTGVMDDTLIDQYGTGAPYWSGRELHELPGILLGHQVPEGEPYEGSFYWRFDHSNGGFVADEIAGYTEDAVFGTLGLQAANDANSALGYDSDIMAAQDFLLSSFGPDGVVYDHLVLKEYDFYTYAGEILQALGQTILDGDLNLADGVDLVDYSIFTQSWGDTGCTACEWCNCADLDKNGVVDEYDLYVFCDYYLIGG